MLPKQHRLTTSEFERTFRKGKRFRVNEFLFIVCPSHDTKLSVVAGKKVSRIAPTRNRLRRQLYHQVEKYLWPLMQGKRVICLYNGGEILQNPAAFQSVATMLLRKLKTK